jgi:small basic protein
MLALFGLVVGAVLAILLRPSVPQELSRYVVMAVIAAIDSAFGGVRAYMERTFNDRIFVIAFLLNAALAIVLVWIGDQLAADLAAPYTVNAIGQPATLESGLKIPGGALDTLAALKDVRAVLERAARLDLPALAKPPAFRTARPVSSNP